MSTVSPAPGRLYEIAYRQKLLLYSLLFTLLADGSAMLSRASEKTDTAAVATLLGIIVLVLALPALAFRIWAWYKLGVAMGYSSIGSACRPYSSCCHAFH